MSTTSEARNVVATAAVAFVAAVTAATGQGSSTLPAAMPVGSRAEATALRARGQLLGYNLDRDAALASFREAMAADPTDPAALPSDRGHALDQRALRAGRGDGGGLPRPGAVRFPPPRRPPRALETVSAITSIAR